MRTAGYRVATALSVLFVIAVIAGSPVHPAWPQDGKAKGERVTVINGTANPVPVTIQGGSTVSSSVSVTNTPSVNVANTPTVSVGNTPTVNIGNSLKPSQLVTARFDPATSSNCINLLTRPDGTSGPFSIPAGKVLIVRNISLGIWAAAGNQIGINLARNTAYNTFDVRTLTATGATTVAIDYPVGVVIRPGLQVCAYAMPGLDAWGLAAAALQGYLADDE